MKWKRFISLPQIVDLINDTAPALIRVFHLALVITIYIILQRTSLNELLISCGKARKHMTQKICIQVLTLPIISLSWFQFACCIMAILLNPLQGCCEISTCENFFKKWKDNANLEGLIAKILVFLKIYK